MKYYVFDIDGCAYTESIRITTSKPKRAYEYIGCFETAYEANMAASKYIYDVQRQIDLSHCREEYEVLDENGNWVCCYPEFDEDYDYIDFVNDDYEDDYDDEYDDNDYDDYEDDDDEYI